MKMNPKSITESVKHLLCQEVEVEQRGLDRFVVNTPFTFDDGDHYVSVVERVGSDYYVSDCGHTFMHMSYDDVDFFSGTRKKVVDEALSLHGLECADGVLRLRIPNESLIGHAVFSFVQAISKVTNVTKFTKDIVRSTFVEDVAKLLEELAEGHQVERDWYDTTVDPDGLYIADFRIVGSPHPWLIFAVHNDNKCKDATITCLQMEKTRPNVRRLAIFEDQAGMNSRDVARLTDVLSKSFSSLGARDRIENYVRAEIFGLAQ